MRDNLISQLQSSILLASLSLIPNDTLRYTLLVIPAGVAVICVIHLKRPSTQLSQLDDDVNKTENIIRDAKLNCPRDLLGLTAKGVRLLEVKRSASMIQCRLLETNTLTWKKYRILSRDISNCAKDVEKILTAVQLTVEAERQRKYTEDINETEAILTSLHSPGREVPDGYHNIPQMHQQYFIYLDLTLGAAAQKSLGVLKAPLQYHVDPNLRLELLVLDFNIYAPFSLARRAR
ncbi:hypothetical protein FB451DRAFT_1552205 [Mycena latifolia]|nr:hypothetical protein FB451DRAFT_1552205 [Mycena latifolia]